MKGCRVDVGLVTGRDVGSWRGFLATGGAVGDGVGAVTWRRTMVAGVGDGRVGISGGGHCDVGGCLLVEGVSEGFFLAGCFLGFFGADVAKSQVMVTLIFVARRSVCT